MVVGRSRGRWPRSNARFVLSARFSAIVVVILALSIDVQVAMAVA
jgi:hypothetical protein